VISIFRDLGESGPRMKQNLGGDKGSLRDRLYLVVRGFQSFSSTNYDKAA
jgi:hypothetical protein